MQLSAALLALAAATLTAAQGFSACHGSIISTDGSFGDNPDNLICCQGDPNHGIGGGPTSCTAGTAIPMTVLLAQTATGATNTATNTMTTTMSTTNKATNTATNTATTTMSTTMSAATGGSATSTRTSTGGAIPLATAGPLAGVAVVGGVLMML